MSTPAWRPPVGPILLRSLLFSAAISALALWRIYAARGWSVLGAFAHPHAPHIAPILAASPAIKVHLLTVAGAIGIGIVLASGVKGNRLHRTLGWTWSACMLATALVTLFIHAPVGLPSIAGIGLLHIFAAVVLVFLPLGLLAARRHDTLRHARAMTGLLVGGLGAAGLFAFMPGRLMWQVLFG
jgi:uncharacterized membrane protein